MDNIFSRFIEIWKPGFLKKFAKEDKVGKTFAFWFFWTAVFSVIITVFTMSSLKSFGDDIIDDLPDGEFIVEDGILSTEGIDEPVFESDSDSVFVMDTKGTTYDETVLDDYESGVFISDTAVYNKDGSNVEKTEFKEFRTDFTLSKEDVEEWVDRFSGVMYAVMGGVVFFAIWFFWSVFKLLSAFVWALIFWILALILKAEPYSKNYLKVYLAVLNLYFIPIVLEVIIVEHILGLGTPMVRTILLAVFFVMGYMKLKGSSAEATATQGGDSDVPTAPEKPEEPKVEEAPKALDDEKGKEEDVEEKKEEEKKESSFAKATADKEEKKDEEVVAAAVVSEEEDEKEEKEDVEKSEDDAKKKE